MLYTSVLSFIALTVSVSALAVPNEDTIEARYGGGYGPSYPGAECNGFGCPGYDYGPYGGGRNYYKRDDMQANVERAEVEVDSNVTKRQEAGNGIFERADLAGPAESTIGTWEGLANGVLGSGVGVFGGGGSGASQGSSQQAARPIPQSGNRGPAEGVQLGSGGGAARPQGSPQFGEYAPSSGGSSYGGVRSNGGGGGIGGGIYKREDATAEVTLE